MMEDTLIDPKRSIARKGITAGTLQPPADDTVSGFLRLYPGGRMCKVHAPPRTTFRTPQREAPKRGIVTEFSAKSRNRLRCLFAQMHRKADARFITLTYKENQTDGSKAKTDLHAFFSALERDYPSVCAVWKMEFQERGSIHFHLLAWGGWIDKGWLSTTWDRIANPNVPNGASASTQIEFIRDRGATGGYLLKYLCKDVRRGATARTVRPDGSAASIGRVWGVHARTRLPLVSDRVLRVRADVVRTILELWAIRFGVEYPLQTVTIFLTSGEAAYLERIAKSHAYY